jgi:hypothetical protein
MDLVFSVYYLAAPLLLIDLKANPVQLGLVGTLASLIHMGMAHLMGHLSDRLGRRRLIIAAPVIFCATCLLMTQVREVWIILALSVINGLCLSIYWPSLQAWIADRQTGPDLPGTLQTLTCPGPLRPLPVRSFQDLFAASTRGSLLCCGWDCPDAFSLIFTSAWQASLNRKTEPTDAETSIGTGVFFMPHGSPTLLLVRLEAGANSQTRPG